MQTHKFASEYLLAKLKRNKYYTILYTQQSIHMHCAHLTLAVL